MAFSTWDSAFEAIPATGNNPALGPVNIQDTKVGVRTVLGKEHEYISATGVFTGEHLNGSAKSYFDDYSGGDEEYQPDGTTALDDEDAGRLQVDTTDNSLKVYTGTTDGWKHLFEDDAVDSSQDPTGTLSSLQQKIDALAHQIAHLTGGAWTATDLQDVSSGSSPSFSQLTVTAGTRYYSATSTTDGVVYSALYSGLLDGVYYQASGALFINDDGVKTLAYIRRSGTTIYFYGMDDSWDPITITATSGGSKVVYEIVVSIGCALA